MNSHSNTEIYRVSHFTTPPSHGSVPLRRRIALRRGGGALTDQRVNMSGGTADAEVQLVLEVTSLSKQARQKLLAEAGVGTEIDATQALAIKSDLSIPWWYRILILRRLYNCSKHTPVWSIKHLSQVAEVMECVHGVLEDTKSPSF